MSIVNPKNYCILQKHMLLLAQTIEQLLSNFGLRKA